ncbi:hypothetical protein O5476_07070 [Escherichia coli]|nr:hypothetical protein [Escherichia coli]
MLYCQFNGRNMEELRRQYRLSQPQIYQIALPAKESCIHGVISLICSHLKARNNRHPAGCFLSL